MMQWFKFARTFLLIVMGASGVVEPIAVAQVPRSSVFSAPLDAVWQSAIETVADTHFEVQSSDKSSGVIWLKEFRASGGDAYANNLVRRYTTQKVSNFNNWLGMSISGSVTVKSQGDSTEVVCHLSYAGYKKGFVSEEWKPLESNGYLESGIFTGISNRLKNTPVVATKAAGNPQPENSGSEELIRLADNTIQKFRKVDAGFKLDASADTITSSLIEAQAQFDEFAAYKSSSDISKLRENLTTALDALKKARTTSGQDRTDALVQSRAAMDAAADAVRAIKPATK